MNRSLLAILTMVVLVGCLKTRNELAAEETGRSQQRQTVAQQQQHAASPTRERPAEKAAPGAHRFEEYDEQLRALNGRVDGVETSIAQLSGNKQGERELGAKEKQATELKFQAYEDALKKMEAQILALNEEVARLKPPPEPTPVAAGGKTKSVYDQGEELFAAKKWKDAIVHMQKYRDQNPKGKLFPEATYKIGLCFQELGMKDEARAFFEEVVAKFPKSKEAKKATFRLKSLK